MTTRRPVPPPKRRRRRRKLTVAVVVLVTPTMASSLRQAAALFGMTISATVRSALRERIERAHAVRPAIDVPTEAAQ